MHNLSSPRRLMAVVILVMGMMISVGTTMGQEDHPLAGQSIEMSILGLGGWLPSSLGADMANELFIEYATENYGYEVSFTFTESPFESLFQRAAASLATGSDEFNIIISDSQWLGALATPGWIVDIDELIANGIPDMDIPPQPDLDLELYSNVARQTYQVFPDGSDEIWGLPQEGDVQVLFVRTDIVNNPDEMAAFEEANGFAIPETFEEWEALTMTDFELIAEWFTRPDEDLYGIAMQHSVVYDYYSMQLYPFMWSRGGNHWDEAGRTMVGTLDTEINAEAMEWNRRMLNYTPPGALSMGIGENVDAFTQGTVATALQWAAVGLSMVTEENADSVAIVPPPAFEGEDGELTRIYSMGGQPWVINAFNTPEQMRVAVDFLNWWYLPETQIEFAVRGGNPATAEAMNSPEFEDLNPWNRAYKYMLEDGRARDFWHEPNYSEMLALQQEEFTAYAAGEYDDALSVLQFVACEQQEILFDNGRTEEAPPEACEDVEPE